MQNGEVLAARLSGNALPTTAPTPVVQAVAPQIDMNDPANGPIMAAPVVDLAAMPVLAMPTLMNRPETQTAPIGLASVGLDDAAGDVILAQSDSVAGCDIGMAAAAGPQAMVAVAITAPCAPSTQFIVHHQGMMFSAVTEADGSAQIFLPALAPVAVVMAEFASGQSALTTVEVPDFGDYDRAVLMWQGDQGLQIHAREFGADYGSEGHVWYGAPRSGPDGGFLIRLGDVAPLRPFVADVYTFPSGASHRDGEVLITVEAEITSENCGKDVIAQSLQLRRDAPALATDLTMQMPSCDGVGDFLVLKNMFEDLKLAAN